MRIFAPLSATSDRPPLPLPLWRGGYAAQKPCQLVNSSTCIIPSVSPRLCVLKEKNSKSKNNNVI